MYNFGVDKSNGCAIHLPEGLNISCSFNVLTFIHTMQDQMMMDKEQLTKKIRKKANKLWTKCQQLCEQEITNSIFSQVERFPKFK